MATARVARPPPGLAFREGAGPGDAPVVTFEAKRAFDAFTDSLTAETMNRATRPYDVMTASAGSGTARGESGKGHEQRAEPPSTSGAARGAAVVRATRELAARSRASAGARDDDGAETRSSSETPLQRFEREMRAKADARAAPAPFHTVPAHIPLAQDMRREAALDCGVTGSRYPNGPYEPFSWVFNREPEKGAFGEKGQFRRHFPSLKPVHLGQSLGDAVDLRPLVEAERACAEDMRAMRSKHGKFHACQRVVGEFDKPAKAVFYPAEEMSKMLHRPGHFARAAPVRHEGAIDADGRLVPTSSRATDASTVERRHDSSDRAARDVSQNYPPKQPRSNPRLAGAGAKGGGFFAPGKDADGMETRSVKACSAYATRLIANGRVGGTVVPKDGLGRRVGNPLIGATAGKHVRRGTPLGAFEGVSIEQRARVEEKAVEEKQRRKNAARRIYELDVHDQGGFKFEQARSRAAKAEASADSFRGAAEKALGFNSPRAGRDKRAKGIRKSASFTRFPPTYAVREKKDRDAFDAREEEGMRGGGTTTGTSTEPNRFARISSPSVVREYSRLTMGAAPRKGGEVWTPGASASANVGGWTWRDAATPVPTSLERGDVKGLPRHSAARARVRKEDSVRKLSLRPSATLV